jgi:hypothetical protein
VNATYVALIWELIDETSTAMITPKMRRILRVRSLITLSVFAAAAFVALKYPVIGLVMCICSLALYVRPEPPWVHAQTGDNSDTEDS